MFRIACFFLLLATFAFGESLRWADLVESRIYKADRKIEFVRDNVRLTINEGDELRLRDFKPMQVINVHLAEFKIIKCSNTNFVSEMVLIDPDQGDGAKAAVGVDVAKGCLLEVFIEKKDYNARSIFR